MRRVVAAALLTIVASLVPGTVAHGEPSEPPAPSQTQPLWPVCVQVLGTWVCIPP
jgi:hypothetical protein